MCIVLATTAHPSYSLIVIDNRDEFVTRPTSRPHWWSAHHQHILSSRDLLRAEQGTWLGITQTGNFAVLTNYRETDGEQPVQGLKSRGGMVTAWLTSPHDEGTEHFVQRLLQGDGFKGVGGFSLLCGKLRKRQDQADIDPLAIISNRSETPDEVPWIAEKRGQVYGLSNTSYGAPIDWPKVRLGKEKLWEAVEESISASLGEEELVDKLYGVLDIDTLPGQPDDDFEAHLLQLKESIFIPPIGKEVPASEVPDAEHMLAAESSAIDGPVADGGNTSAKRHEPADPVSNIGMTGVYGTQRQTIMLVDWEGNVSFRERSLFDAHGRSIEKGTEDVKFEFKIDGWNGESKGNEVRTLALL